MHIALIADAFPPMRSSGAVQLRDLARELVKQGHRVTVLTPAPDQRRSWEIEDHDGVEVVRLKAFRTRDTSYARRAFGELLMPFLMLRNFRKSPAARHRFHGVVWYSPNIFLGPIVKALKRRHKCRSYLILRDIFPDWMADMGLMKRGPIFYFFKAIAAYQYSVADVIGVQTPGNLSYFGNRPRVGPFRVEVLQNWLADAPSKTCSIDFSSTRLADRTILVYAGNMGVAQGMTKLIDLAERIQGDKRVGFAFVGRGTDVAALQDDARQRGLENVLFFDEIDPDEIPGLYAQADIGLVTLDVRHRTHNIPGKFISYMHAGLPALASINPGNDLEVIIQTEDVGRVSTDPDGADLAGLVRAMVADKRDRETTASRCKALARRLFSADASASQIVRGLAG